MLKKFFNKEVRPHKDAWIVIFCVLVFAILRVPSLVEPYWYGDEGIYQVIGKALNSGKVLYEGIWDNKPPLLYYIYALFNGEQFLVRMFSLIVGSLSVVSFYFLGKKLFKNKKSIIVSTLLYVLLFGSPIFEGNIANAENFMHLPIILSALLLFKYFGGKKKAYIFLSGIVLSVAFMTKIVAVFEFSAFLIFLFLINHPSFEFRKLIKYLNPKELKIEALFLLGFMSILGFFVVYFSALNAFPEFLSGVLAENIDYVGYGNTYFFPMGILLIKTLIAIGLLFFIYINRKKLSQSSLFIYLWLVLALFSTFFSHRPYLHYVLMSALPCSYFVGSIIEERKHRLIKIFAAVIALLLIYNNFGIYSKTISYYNNYLQFTSSNKSVEEYQAFFDPNTPRDYELARFIEMFSNGEKYDVFLWSDSGQIYALSDTLPPGKYIVGYHITNYNDAVSYMVEQVNKKRPTYIIKTKESPEFKEFLPSYTLRYKISDAYIYERQN